MSGNTLVAAIDIGTTKTVVFIADVRRGRELNIIGFGERPSAGLRKGEIFDMGLAKEAAHNAIADAERNAGVSRVGRAFMSLTGAHLDGRRFTGAASVATGFVSEEDVERARADVKRRRSSAGRVIVHYVQQPCFVDNTLRSNPVGIRGRQVEVGYWTIEASSDRLLENLHIPNDFGVIVDSLIVSSLASSTIVAEDAMKQNGVLVIDIGGGVTDYALYYRGHVVSTGVVPVGGDHITNDLALGLRITHRDAEDIKTTLARAYVGRDDSNATVLYRTGGSAIGGREFRRSSINAIVDARTDEIFKIIRTRLGEYATPERLAAGVVLTGGTSKLNGIDQRAADSFNMRAIVGQPPEWVPSEFSAAQYSTALGLLRYALEGGADPRETSAKPPGLLGKFRRLFQY